jgi:hypothetical protein
MVCNPLTHELLLLTLLWQVVISFGTRESETTH